VRPLPEAVSVQLKPAQLDVSFALGWRRTGARGKRLLDLTPYAREDILLAFPQHPLCDPGCRGLPQKSSGEPVNANNTGHNEADLSAWAELDKLKL